MINGYWIVQRHGPCDIITAPDIIMVHSEQAAFNITKDLNEEYTIKKGKQFFYTWQYVDNISHEEILPLVNIAAVIDRFDKDLGDPLKALQLIAGYIGLYKNLVDDETLDDYYNQDTFTALTEHDN